MAHNQPVKGSPATDPVSAGWGRWFPLLSWGVAGAVVILLIALLVWRTGTAKSAGNLAGEADNAFMNETGGPASLPEYDEGADSSALIRHLVPHTILPTAQLRESAQTYTVEQGDSIFGIAKSFDLDPETVLWANYDALKDNADMISPGQVLTIPPEDGVFYQWQDGDTAEGVAAKFSAQAVDLLAFPGNHLDITNPQIQPGTFVMVPGGKRESKQWVVPTIPRGQAGVLRSILGAGACDTEGGALGTGTFIWPASTHAISGNDFWSGHLGLDIAAGMGTPIVAVDAGVVVYAGAISGGYGNMVMIDHGNGYQSLYGHLSQISTRCGRSVNQGTLIGMSGSTGNSTGPHLHFEIRYMGGFINPWTVLP